jgi:hypothetical protein
MAALPSAVTDMPKLQLPTPHPKLEPQFIPPEMAAPPLPPKTADELHLELNTRAFKLIANEIDRFIKIDPTIEDRASLEWRRKYQGGPGNLPTVKPEGAEYSYQEAMDPYNNWEYTFQHVYDVLDKRYPEWTDEQVAKVTAGIAVDPSFSMMLIFGVNLGMAGLFGSKGMGAGFTGGPLDEFIQYWGNTVEEGVYRLTGAAIKGGEAAIKTGRPIANSVFDQAVKAHLDESGNLFLKGVKLPKEVDTSMIKEVPNIPAIVESAKRYGISVSKIGPDSPISFSGSGWIAPDGTVFETAGMWLHGELPSKVGMLGTAAKSAIPKEAWELAANSTEDLLHLGWIRFTEGGDSVTVWQLTPRNKELMSQLWTFRDKYDPRFGQIKLPKEANIILDEVSSGKSYDILGGSWESLTSSRSTYRVFGKPVPDKIMAEIERYQMRGGYPITPDGLMAKISRNERFTPEEEKLIRQPAYRDVKTKYQEWETENPAFTPQRTMRPTEVLATEDEAIRSTVNDVLDNLLSAWQGKQGTIPPTEKFGGLEVGPIASNEMFRDFHLRFHEAMFNSTANRGVEYGMWTLQDGSIGWVVGTKKGVTYKWDWNDFSKLEGSIASHTHPVSRNRYGTGFSLGDLINSARQKRLESWITDNDTLIQLRFNGFPGNPSSEAIKFRFRQAEALAKRDFREAVERRGFSPDHKWTAQSVRRLMPPNNPEMGYYSLYDELLNKYYEEAFNYFGWTYHRLPQWRMLENPPALWR